MIKTIKKYLNKQLGIFLFNLKLGVVMGFIGLIAFLVFQVVAKKTDNNYKYHIYDTSAKEVSEKARIVHRKAHIKQLRNYYNGGEDNFIRHRLTYTLPCNRAWILDTIDGEIIKFRVIYQRNDSEVRYKGFTHISNIHSEPHQECD